MSGERRTRSCTGIRSTDFEDRDSSTALHGAGRTVEDPARLTAEVHLSLAVPTVSTEKRRVEGR